jgi:hypothetical protein
MPKDQTPPTPIAVLGGLTLSKGDRTRRALKCCESCATPGEEDLDQTIPLIVVDADAQYDPVSLEIVITEQTTSNYKCNGCGAEDVDDYPYMASNSLAVKEIIDELLLDATLPERIALGQLSNHQHRNADRTITYQCDRCACPEITWDSYAYTDPITGRLYDPQTFQAYCPTCDDEKAHISEIPCSAHDEIEFELARQKRAQSARQQIKDIFNWIDVAGPHFGIASAAADRLRSHHDEKLVELTAKTKPL